MFISAQYRLSNIKNYIYEILESLRSATKKANVKININCEEFYFDMGDCESDNTDFSLDNVCSDSYTEPGTGSYQKLKMDWV